MYPGYLNAVVPQHVDDLRNLARRPPRPTMRRHSRRQARRTILGLPFPASAR